MILPPNAKESEAYIYVSKEDAILIEADPEFEPIQGTQSNVHGNVVGFINGKLVIIVREF